MSSGATAMVSDKHKFKAREALGGVTTENNAKKVSNTNKRDYSSKRKVDLKKRGWVTSAD